MDNPWLDFSSDDSDDSDLAEELEQDSMRNWQPANPQWNHGVPQADVHRNVSERKYIDWCVDIQKYDNYFKTEKVPSFLSHMRPGNYRFYRHKWWHETRPNGINCLRQLLNMYPDFIQLDCPHPPEFQNIRPRRSRVSFGV